MAEKEYIDKDKLLNDIECIDISCCTDIDDIFTEVERTIDEQPTADVQEVVRCGLCKNYKLRGGSKWCVLHMIRMHSDDYCSYGEIRKITLTDTINRQLRSEQE